MKTLPIVVALSVAGAVLAAQDDPLRTARDLYASAAYEEALYELARVGRSDAPAPAAALEMDAYRAFCLVALGRSGEAETIAESLVRKDPMFTVDQYRDASPRIAAMFATVRKRMMPQLVREEYRTARTRVAEKATDAGSHLIHVRQLLGEAEKIGAWDETLEDLRTLVDGFLELSRAPRPPAPPSSAPAAVEQPGASVSVSSPAAPVESGAEAAVVAPVVVSQPAPRVPPELLALVRNLHRTGTIDVVIDERGSVEDVIVRQSINAAFDAWVVAAVRTWKYRPAMKDGVPVRYVKTVVIDAQ
jgi:TonB family protein